MKDEIIKVLNKYSTTNIGWIEEAHGERTLLIDPMDYHKIASELSALQEEKEEPKAEAKGADMQEKPISSQEVIDYVFVRISDLMEE